jgi:hypothetical protein
LKRRQERIEIIKNPSGKHPSTRLYIATPTLGIIRTEWAAARWGQVIPCNWSCVGGMFGYTHSFPMGYLVADAQNIAVQGAIKENSEWLLLLEDDVVAPPDLFLKLNDYINKATVPVVSGLYYTKSNPTEPLVYRGRGSSFYSKWKRGDKVWADGVPTGCLLIHMSVLKLMYDESPEYMTSMQHKAHRVFETPRKVWTDPEKGMMLGAVGTSDLYWCDRVMRDKVLERTGWKRIAKKKFPLLVDTGIFCKHIDLQTGKQYPIGVR